MTIKCLFIQRRESYPEQHAPELLAAVDEYTDDENPDYFADACASALKEIGDDAMAHRVIELAVDGDDIRKALLSTPRLSATMKETP